LYVQLSVQSLIDEAGLSAVNEAAQKSADALARGDAAKATQYWSDAETVVSDVTGGVNVYNILDWNSNLMHKKTVQLSDGKAITFNRTACQ
jgi:hypothetical protein